MAVVGIGIDVADLDRFRESTERTPSLAARLLTPAECSLSLESQAARFAAKEALAKALGAPGGLAWHDAEVHCTEAGQPYFEVRGTVAARAHELGVQRLHLSLSHDGGVATAMVVAED
ncbi:holo-ACP synthase [Nocardioides panacisoli]|uniref:holo-ACP synthase n=1 Tax=Nocardioides panacisoli TaxID=627624 RepID=UPI001C6380C7|nr:holo-ACP synthase [Nocardioides panacisoli]QYJ02588.1 holo-ACP synthase [Nocardioides panacisoli]